MPQKLVQAPFFLIRLTTPTSRKRGEESEEAKERETSGAECEETLKHFK